MDERGEILKIELLLEASRGERYRDPERMVYLAELAREALGRLDPSERVADLRVRVSAELGNAYRLSDRLALAEEALSRAADLFEESSRDPALLALIADRLASLLCHRRRFPEALALLDRLYAFHKARSEDHLAGRSLLLRGLYSLYDCTPELAVEYTLKGLELIDVEEDPGLLLSAVHNLLWCATELGRFDLAGRLLPSVRHLYGEDSLNLLRLRWVEGRIAEGADRLDEAERIYHEVREGFLAKQLVFPASMVSVDLALLLLAEKRRAEIIPLADELICAFQALRVGREAVLAFLVLKRSIEEEGAAGNLRRRILEVLTVLQDLERRER